MTFVFESPEDELYPSSAHMSGCFKMYSAHNLQKNITEEP